MERAFSLRCMGTDRTPSRSRTALFDRSAARRNFRSGNGLREFLGSDPSPWAPKPHACSERSSMRRPRSSSPLCSAALAGLRSRAERIRPPFFHSHSRCMLGSVQAGRCYLSCGPVDVDLGVASGGARKFTQSPGLGGSDRVSVREEPLMGRRASQLRQDADCYAGIGVGRTHEARSGSYTTPVRQR
jgi:hypothetical protein